MRLRLDTTEALAARIPGLQTDQIRAVGGRKHVGKRQNFLADVVGAAYSGRRAHARNSNDYGSAFTMSRDEWVQGLAASPNRYKRLLESLFDFPQGNLGYSRDDGHTKPYNLKEHVLSAARAVFTGEAPLPVHCRDTNNLVTLNDVPANGLSEDVDLPFTVPSILCLSLDDVDRAIETVERWKTIYGYGHAPLDPDKPDKDTLDGGLQLLHVCRQWIVSLGGVPNFYRLQGHGRLGPADCIAPHIITMPAMLRRVLLSSSGLVDYDLRACFWSVFSSLGHSMGFSTEYADRYQANRGDWHSYLASVTQCGGRKVGRIKTTMLSWLSGAPLSANPHTSAVDLLGASGAAALIENDAAKALHREVRAGLKVILERAPRITLEKYRAPINAVGLPLQGKARQPTLAQQAAHLFTGYEQFAIRAMCSRVAELRAIIYDGFIAPPQDTRALEEHVRRKSEEQLGFPLRVSLKAVPFSTPIAEPNENDIDF